MQVGVDYIGVTLVFLCHDGKGSFVMAKRSEQARDDRNRWDIGGGKLDVHESVDTALEREILEEYCTPVLSQQFLGYRDVHRIDPEGRPMHWIALDFAVQVDPTTVKIGEPHKFTDLQWYTLATMPPELETHSQWPAFLKNYCSDLQPLLRKG